MLSKLVDSAKRQTEESVAVADLVGVEPRSGARAISTGACNATTYEVTVRPVDVVERGARYQRSGRRRPSVDASIGSRRGRVALGCSGVGVVLEVGVVLSWSGAELASALSLVLEWPSCWVGV